jgi:hypothetical protein
MATNTTPTTLGSLEFSQIKQSLTDYLKNQSIFAGYNFEGSAIQTMIDLMAYNTFYYAYYANMINAEAFLDSAQKEDSIISLCKPLGYTVPSRTAAKALVSVSGLSVNTDIPPATRFITTNSDGANYSFYNLDTIPVVDGLTDQFYIYEASRYVSFDALPTFDFESQKVTIADQNFDISSIQVTITESLDEATTLEQVWTPVGNIGYTARIDENIYFIERTSTGFAILFGSENSVGRSIDSNITKIIIRYITTNGAEGNNLSIFRAPSLSGIVTTASFSSGGKSNLDLDLVRFVAPKWFAAQERAVTVNDYKALLLQSGYFTDENQFNVVGGQDLEPPKYGRVFITSSLDSTNELVPRIIDFLKERSVITVLPEYVETRTINFYTDFNFRLGPATPNTSQKKAQLTLALKSLFQSNYGALNKFNVEFSASNFIDLIRSNSNTDISGIIISPDDFSSYLREVITGTNEVLYNVGNELYLPPFEYVDITDQFDSDYVGPGEKAVIRMYVSSNSSKNNINNLQLWAINITTGAQRQITGFDIGYFIANKGVVKINPGFIKETATLTLLLAKKSFKIGLLDRVTHTYGTVAVL